jgi:hypothetical protein
MTPIMAGGQEVGLGFDPEMSAHEFFLRRGTPSGMAYQVSR